MSAPVRLSYSQRPSAVPYMLRGVLPVQRRRELQPDIAALWMSHRADPAELATYHAITGLPQSAALPILYPHTFGFRLAMAVLTHPSFPVPIWGVLQTRNHLRLHRSIPVGAAMDIETRVLGGRALAKGAEFDLGTTLRVDEALAWESVVTFFTRGRFGAPGLPSPLARSPTEYGPLRVEWTPRDHGHRAFGRFTGDYNGLHFWDAYARRFGFSRALYHPQRMLAESLAQLGMPASDAPLSLDAWLKGPVPHRTPVRLHAIEDAGGAMLALHVEPDRPCIVVDRKSVV